MTTNGIIYKFTSPNGKVYIGQTVNEEHRKSVHRNQAKNPKDYFHRAIRKYGFENFKYEIIFRTKSKDTDKLKYLLDTMEKYFIKKYDSTNPSIGYNLTIGGEGTVGYHHTKESKQKMSLSHIGLDNHQLGRHHSVDSKRKISSSKMGGDFLINQYTLDGQLINSYKTIVEASKATGALRTSISNCLAGRSKKCKGFLWKKVRQN